MLIATMGVETFAFDLVGSSQVPYQLRLHLEDKRLSAGMLVQDDRSVNAVINRLGFELTSEKIARIEKYIGFAKDILHDGNSFITNIKRHGNLPGRHAIVVTGILDSCFLALDPDCQLSREENYEYSDIKDRVTYRFSEEEFIQAISGEEEHKPILGQLSRCTPKEPQSTILQSIFQKSNEALQFYKAETKDLEFADKNSMQAIYSVIKPVILDLRTAIEIRDTYLKQESAIAVFLKEFETDVLLLRKKRKNQEIIPSALIQELHDSLTKSYMMLENHLSYESFIE